MDVEAKAVTGRTAEKFSQTNYVPQYRNLRTEPGLGYPSVNSNKP
jgi:hypothetical protein